MYNKKALRDIVKNLGSAKAPTKKRDIIYDPMGQWTNPGQNTRVPTPNGNITMGANPETGQPIPFPVFAQPNVGPGVMMQPGQDYTFPGAKYVDEFPQVKKGGLVKQPKKYSKSLMAKNILFVKNAFINKKKSVKNKIFDPNSPYFQDGGTFEIKLDDAEIDQYKQGGYIVEELDAYAGGGSSSCPKDHVWDSNTKKCVKVYTLANDKKLIDGVSNWAMQSNDPDKISSEYNDQIKHYLYSGKYGYDPVSGTLYPLKKDQKTVADAETKKILAKQDDKAAYTQSIIDAGFDPDTFGKSKGTNVITGEEIYGDKSQEDVDKINKEAVSDFVTEGHRKAILESPFNIAASFTPMGMAAGVMQGGAALLPDAYNFANDPSWSGAGAIGGDLLMMAPGLNKFGKFLGAESKTLSAPKSEINWGKWNKEIPENKSLMQEYTAIEETSKANGTWMKNADGTPFDGTPEQFVQQQSSNFKKAYPEGTTTTYRGDATHIPTLINKNSVGNAVFTGEEDLAKHYTGNTDYYNSNIFSTENKIIPKDQWDSYSEAMKNSTLSKYGDNLKIVDNASDPGLTPAGMHKLYVKNSDNQVIIDAKNADWHSIENPFSENIRIDKQLGERTKDYAKQGDYVNTDQIARVLEEQGIDKAIINNIQDGKLGNILINNQKPGNYLKSMMGNSGMFDLNNPNIYKAIIPAVGGTGLMLNNPGVLPQQNKYGGLHKLEEKKIILDLSPEEIQQYKNGGYIVEDINEYKEGGALLTKKVTCKNCGWTWDAADGGNDMTTCHKCGGKGLIHAQDGGDISIPSLTRMDNGAQVKGSQGLNPDFSTNLTAFINAAKADGIDLGIGSGFRTVERQKQLWEQALKKYGSPEKARKWVAPPGRSNHNRGTAVDLNSSGAFLGKNKNTKATQWAHANAEKFGLHFRMGHEPWHIEPLNLSKEQKAKIDAEHQHSDNEDPNTHVDPNNVEALSKEGIDMTKYYKNLGKEPEITGIDNDYSNWNPQEEVVVDPRIAQLNAYSKLMAPSIQNVNDMYAATKINQQQQQKQFAKGGYIDTELTDREIANYKNGGYIVEYLD